MKFIKSFFITRRFRDLVFNFVVFTLIVYLLAGLQVLIGGFLLYKFGWHVVGLTMSDTAFNIFMFSVMGIMIAGYLYSLGSKLFKKR